MKSRYRIKIIPPARIDYILGGPLPLYCYEITDGLNGPVLKRGNSRSIKGWMGAWYAAEKTIKRLLLKEECRI